MSGERRAAGRSGSETAGESEETGQGFGGAGSGAGQRTPHSGNTLWIRELQELDIEPLAEIESRSFSMPWSAQAYRELLDATGAYYLVAERSGTVLGCAGMRILCGEGQIDNVVVDEPYRGQGVGRALLEALLAGGEERGAEEFTLEVRESNKAARRLYESEGFACEGIRPGYYEKPREDALILWKRMK